MYEEFYHLTEKPFTLSPDPAFLYLGKSHRRAMNILEYGVESESGKGSAFMLVFPIIKDVQPHKV